MQDFGQGCASESEVEDDNEESGEEGTSASEIEGENGESNEETSGSDDDVDVRASAEALKKLAPHSLEEFAKVRHGNMWSCICKLLMLRHDDY